VKNMANGSSSSRNQTGKSAEQNKVVSFGEMVAAAFDRAEIVTSDPAVVANLATRTVGRWLGRTGRADMAELVEGAQPDPRRAGRRTPLSRAA
jgi:hypothetical protein